MIRACLTASALLCAALVPATPAVAHPHVFIDMQIEAVFGVGSTLEALNITWRFDPFETLYMLSEEGVVPTADGRLDEAARTRMASAYTDWDPDFDGFAQLSLDGAGVALDPPAGVTARLIDGRLEISFSRALAEAAPLAGTEAEIAAFEATYFYAVTVAEPPVLAGEASECQASLFPFEPDAQVAAVQKSLFDLGREETPETEGVGALFADRVVLSCE